MPRVSFGYRWFKLRIFERFNSQKFHKMVFLLTPPDSVRGMTVLNREAFTITVQVPCLNLDPVTNNKVVLAVKKYLLKLKSFKSVQSHDNRCIIYLDPEKVEKFDDFDDSSRKIISKFCTTVETSSLTLKYENWSANQIFKAVLPADLEMPTSYTKAGHILHLNLRDNQLPFKTLIGQVYLDCIPHIKTVVNKLNTIETEFRHFPMEILAGEVNTVTTVKENGCSFTFDFAKVYWNSRLSTEHENLLKYMEKNDVLYDVFAGVGPFAVPAARKGVTVLANDLNPESYKWLMSNAVSNKVKNLLCFNKDGREFLRSDVKQHILTRRSDKSPGVEHIAMNLPAIAHEFLDVFRDWMTDDEITQACWNKILVHVYCFVKATKTEDPKPMAQALVEGSIGTKLRTETIKDIHRVRNVAPNKEMLRVSFYLSEDMIRIEEPVTMGNKRKESKTKNAFKVPMKKSLVKAKNKDKQIQATKVHQNTLKKNLQEKAKSIDRELINLRMGIHKPKVKQSPVVKKKSIPKPSPTADVAMLEKLKL